MTKIGAVKYLRRYPVKSMMGEDLDSAYLESYGITGDRVYAFINEENRNTRFPWMTARQAKELLLYRPQFASSQMEIESPEGRKFSISDQLFLELIEEKYGYPIVLRYDRTGSKDSKPISLISMQTVEALSSETGLTLSHERFRANIYAEWHNGKPFFEDELVGRTLKIGEGGAVIKIVKKDSRCIIPTLDPKTSEPSPIVLETIKKNHKGCIGVYADVEGVGSMRAGDEIFLL
ncbi:MAG: MOSC domain-containing protein [Thaumarchaeota archaeon]|nr:MOSC domain-containing protein [Nitrososphaerota archaeon]